MWRDPWSGLVVIGAALACLACLTPLAVLVFGAIGLAAWDGRLDAVALPGLAALVAVGVYRYRMIHRRTP